MAKTLQELYGEVMASEALKKEYLAAANDKKIGELLSSHGCDATAEQPGEFFKNPANLLPRHGHQNRMRKLQHECLLRKLQILPV